MAKNGQNTSKMAIRCDPAGTPINARNDLNKADSHFRANDTNNHTH